MSEQPIGKEGTGNAGGTITPGKPVKKTTYWMAGIIVAIIIVVVLMVL